MAEMTPERIAEIRQREQQATKGPWYVEHDADCREYGPIIEFPWGLVGPTNVGAATMGEDYKQRYGHKVSEISELTENDAQFLAHARQDIPDLLAEVRRLQAERDRLREALTESLALNINWTETAELQDLMFFSEYKAVIKQAKEALSALPTEGGSRG